MNPSTTPTPPAGGYQVGGWYNGQQWNGTSFGAPNVITVGSSAGQTVNPAVVAAGNKAQGLAPGTNEAYLAKVSANPVNPVSANPSATGGTTDVSATVSATTPEIDAINKQIADRQQALSKAQLAINDNPFYSEATRVGKLRSLQEQYNADLVPLNTQLKSLTDAYNAKIKADQTANKTTVKTFTDANGNVSAVAMDGQGNVVNQVNLGSVGKGTKSGKAATTKLTTTDKAVLKEGVASDAKDGHTLQEIVGYYTALGLDTATVYSIYNKNSIYGPAQESLQQVTQGTYATQPGGLPANSGKTGGFASPTQA